MKVNKSYQQNLGFSLWETIVTVIILGILSAIAAPSLIGLYYQTQVKSSLRQVEGAIREAQWQAIRKGKKCKIKLAQISINGKSRNTITIVTNSDPGESSSNYQGCLLSDRILPETVDIITNIPGATNKITFSYQGNTPSSGTIAISAAGTDTKKCLVISNGLGIIRTGNYAEQISGSMAKKCIKEI